MVGSSSCKRCCWFRRWRGGSMNPKISDLALHFTSCGRRKFFQSGVLKKISIPGRWCKKSHDGETIPHRFSGLEKEIAFPAFLNGGVFDSIQGLSWVCCCIWSWVILDLFFGGRLCIFGMDQSRYAKTILSRFLRMLCNVCASCSLQMGINRHWCCQLLIGDGTTKKFEENTGPIADVPMIAAMYWLSEFRQSLAGGYFARVKSEKYVFGHAPWWISFESKSINRRYII